MRRLIIWLLIIAFIYIVIARFSEIESLFQVLLSGRWAWVLAAALLQLAYYVARAATYKAGFSTVGIQSQMKKLVPVMVSSVFVNVAAPTGGMAGAALFVDDAARRGESAPQAAVAALLVLIAEYLAFTPLLAIGILFLAQNHSLSWLEVFCAIVLVFGIFTFTALLLIGLWRPTVLLRLLSWLQRSVNVAWRRMRKTDLLAANWAPTYADEFVCASATIVNHPWLVARTVLAALAAHLMDMLCLAVIFVAFNQPVNLGILVAGYSMCILFWIVSITPQGIGVVEAMMTLVFTSLHVPANQAAVIALSFRGLTFWIPFTLGFVLLKTLPTFKTKSPNNTRP